MQFDMIHCAAPAMLWNPAFVVSSVLWAALLAYLPLRWRLAEPSALRIIALCVLTTPIAVTALASLVTFPSAACTTSVGRSSWMAIPLAAPFVALGKFQPRLHRGSVLARTIVALTCLHAWWTVTLFPSDIAREVGPDSLAGLDAKVAHAPWVAFLGFAAMLLIYVAVERRASVGTWRAWLAVRLQILAACLALVFEVRIASLSMLFAGDPESLMFAPIVVPVFVFALQAWLKLRSPRINGTAAC